MGCPQTRERGSEMDLPGRVSLYLQPLTILLQSFDALGLDPGQMLIPFSSEGKEAMLSTKCVFPAKALSLSELFALALLISTTALVFLVGDCGQPALSKSGCQLNLVCEHSRSIA